MLLGSPGYLVSRCIDSAESTAEGPGADVKRGEPSPGTDEAGGEPSERFVALSQGDPGDHRLAFDAALVFATRDAEEAALRATGVCLCVCLWVRVSLCGGARG